MGCRALVLAGGLAALSLSLSDVFAAGQETGQTLVQAYRQEAGQWPAPWIDADVDFVELGAPPSAAIEPDAAAEGKRALGERLFHAPGLALEGAPSCAGCHRPDHGWSVPTAVATGHGGRRGKRNPPALHATAWQVQWGWDGAFSDLATQALAPLTLAHEMGNDHLDRVLARLRADPELAGPFREAYGAEEITEGMLGDALAAFLRSLDKRSRFDRFVAGDYAQLSEFEIEGLHLFRTKARCANCHFGPQLTDRRFHNLGIAFFGEPSADLGRYHVTGQVEDAGRFRSASLRHVSESAPYMHNGLFRTLEGVINLYDRGGGETWPRSPADAAHPLYGAVAQKSPQLRALQLTNREKAALLAFLKAL